MKIHVAATGIAQEFARAIGATVRGRFIDIPESKGAGYITGFAWGSELRMMIRNYHLHEEVAIEWINEAMKEQETVAFQLSGIFPSLRPPGALLVPEQANVLICRQGVSSLIRMPSNTIFASVTIAASKPYLHRLFGQLTHPVVRSVLEASGTFVYETEVSPQLIKTASDLVQQPVPESLEDQYYKLKCEELLYYIFTLLLQRESVPTSLMRIGDIKAIYAIKDQLQAHLNKSPNIAFLAREAGMSEPKLRKLFKQTFGKGVFDFYQSARMQEAARLLTEKQLSVSEVGYQLGFTNLSHFSRVFEEHTGMKPKKYAQPSKVVNAPLVHPT